MVKLSRKQFRNCQEINLEISERIILEFQEKITKLSRKIYQKKIKKTKIVKTIKLGKSCWKNNLEYVKKPKK